MGVSAIADECQRKPGKEEERRGAGRGWLLWQWVCVRRRVSTTVGPMEEVVAHFVVSATKETKQYLLCFEQRRRFGCDGSRREMAETSLHREKKRDDQEEDDAVVEDRDDE
ncbi:hypothetical protein BHM03_00031673 [Ensete ventricosum]|nr:hypothetical protein BHM03_00031673 [Ensete ventricosum]